MSEDDDEDLAFCTEVALHVVNDRFVVQRGDGVSFYIKAVAGKLESYRRLPDDFKVISTESIPELDEEVRAFWQEHCPGMLPEYGPVSAEDMKRARDAALMLYAQAMRDDGMLH
ncbi:hypothetical protein HVX06_08160 [Enterobacter sp. RHB15-C17]|nr:hypothetical protein HVX06_08160 [Enterobacter sp. RHB15-C17]